jgi:hypothetical protein
MTRALFIALLATVALSLAARADSLITFTGVTANVGTGEDEGYFGQSFTTPGGGPWDNITFNFFDQKNDGTPYAYEDVYLFSHPFTGDASDTTALTSASGYLGMSTGSGAVYQFSPTIQLNGNTQYFIYTGGASGLAGLAIETPGSYTGGDMYYNPDGTTPYVLAQNAPDNPSGLPQDALFQLSGDPVSAATPLPSTMSLGATILPLALLSLAIYRRKTA